MSKRNGKQNGKANGKPVLTDEERNELIREAKRFHEYVVELSRDNKPGTHDAIKEFRIKAQRAALKAVLSM